MATLTVTITAVGSTINATDPATVSRLIEDAANAINVGGVPVAASGSISPTPVLGEISTTVSWTVVKS